MEAYNKLPTLTNEYLHSMIGHLRNSYTKLICIMVLNKLSLNVDIAQYWLQREFICQPLFSQIQNIMKELVFGLIFNTLFLFISMFSLFLTKMRRDCFLPSFLKSPQENFKNKYSRECTIKYDILPSS